MNHLVKPLPSLATKTGYENRPF